MRGRFTPIAASAVIAVALILVALLVFTPSHAQTVTYGTVVVNTSFLNVRSGPGSQFLTIGVVQGGAELPVTGITRDREWWRVQTPFGEGFVFAEFVLYRGEGSAVPFVGFPANAAPQPPTAIVLAPSLNIRSGPSINFPSLGAVPQSTVLAVVGHNVETGWYHVNSPFGFGWVANDEVSLAGDTSIIPRVDATGAGRLSGTTVALPSTASTTGTTTTSSGGGLTFVPSGLNMPGTVSFTVLFVRSRAFYGAPIIGTMAEGDSITVEGRNEDGSFIAVITPFGQGWAPEHGVKYPSTVFDLPQIDENPQLKIAGLPSVPSGADISTGGGPGGYTTQDEIIVHSRPQLEAPAIGSLGAGVRATAIGRDFDIQFYQIPTPFGVGWVRADIDLHLDDNVNPFNIPIMAVNGIPVGGETTPFTTAQGITPSGVVSGGTSGAVSGAVVVVNTPAQNLRSGPGAQYTVIGVVSGGDQFSVVGQLRDGSWFKVQTPFGQGWLFAEFVLFRGDGSTIPVMSS